MAPGEVARVQRKPPSSRRDASGDQLASVVRRPCLEGDQGLAPPGRVLTRLLLVGVDPGLNYNV